MNHEKNVGCATCLSHYLCMPKRHVARLSSAAIIMGILTFVLGYYIGKRNAARELVLEMQQDLLAPRNHPLLTSLHDLPQPTPDNDVVFESDKKEHHEPSSEQASTKKEEHIHLQEQHTLVDGPWKALMAGFGSHKAAVKCAQRLKRAGMDAVVVKRESKRESTSREKQQALDNKTITWYQVVSQPFNCKQDLEKLVTMVSHKEKIVGAQIIKVSNDGNERKNVQN